MKTVIPNIGRDTFDALYDSVEKNIERYRNGEGSWIYDFWKEKGYDVEHRGIDANVVELDHSKDDIDNAIALHEGLSISPMIASSGLFWTIYAHYELPFLLGKRPLTGEDEADAAIVQKYYLCNWDTKDRALERGELSKLWWIVEMTKDNSRTDKYELTREALMQARTTDEILVRSITKSRMIAGRLLEYSLQQRYLGSPLSSEEFRRLTIHLNAVDQTICIDAMDVGELDDAIESFVSWNRGRRERKGAEEEI